MTIDTFRKIEKKWLNFELKNSKKRIEVHWDSYIDYYAYDNVHYNDLLSHVENRQNYKTK